LAEAALRRHAATHSYRPCLANDPKILLLDERIGALDNQTRALMQEMLLGIWERDQKTVLFVTHDIEEAIFLGSRVIVMKRTSRLHQG